MDSKKEIRVTRSSMPPWEEYLREIRPLWESHWLTNMGEYHERLERRLEEYLQAPHLSLFSNGHMALELTLQAMRLTGEVITTPFTFASTTHAIVRNGLQPVFCDIKDSDYTIDPSEIEKLITEKTSAIVPVHVYGNLCDAEGIEKIARKYHLKVIYDAAHAFGETKDGVNCAVFGDASIFSFHATKVFHTIEGGAVSYHEQELGRELYKLKNFGILSETVVDGVGTNAKMNEFQAAMGLCNLRHFQEEREQRKTAAKRYEEILSERKELCLPAKQKGVAYNYGYFPVLFSTRFQRDFVYEGLKEHQIFARKYFYPITSAFDCYRDRFFPEKTPIAQDISARILTLPLYADLSREEVDDICRALLELLAEFVE